MRLLLELILSLEKKFNIFRKNIIYYYSYSFWKLFKKWKTFEKWKKFLKAAERAQKLGKMKNALSFAKAAARAIKKANSVGNYIKNAQKILKLNKFTKFVFKN